MSTDTTTLAPTDADLARLRFFRDLTGDERMKVLRVFGAIPLGAESEVTSHYIERLLFDRMLAKWGAPAPASGEVVAEPKHSLCNDPRLCCRSHPHPDQSMHCQLREVAAWLRWHAATGKTPWPESMHAHAEQVDAVALALTAPPAQEARVPLSDGQIEQGHDAADIAPTDATIGTFTDGVRFAEKHHGITAAQKETP